MNEKKLIKLLITTTLILILLNFISLPLSINFWQFTRLIDLDIEANFSTWFSSMLLAIGAWYAYRCSSLIKTDLKGKMLWRLLSIGLLAMSCDEIAQIHEFFGASANKYIFKIKNLGNTGWIVLGPFILLALLLFVINFKQYLIGSKKAAKFLGLGTIFFIFGAFVLESTINFLNQENLKWLWDIENIIEESFEMFGVIFVIIGLQEYYNAIKLKYASR